ncbi:hypothetical protein G5V59_18300 [Nocardioides sp. W3-2-3]|uniref:hypothetical protein n=1 Tax=Nocardioides convexus TaxID=2712224 RepID=UPI0024181570|nr:hypothetical protein [Nocardioides convexus]NHA01152.1 hypothetical protein [Nocardioides convexus]
MKRSLAVAAALSLTLLAAGCDDGDDTSSAKPSAGASSEASADSPGAGEVENETYPRGADVARFCAVVGEIDDAIDEAEPGNKDHWDRILSAFEALDALGVPDDLPEGGAAEPGPRRVCSSSRAARWPSLNAAVEKSPPPGRTLDDYIDDHCG